MKLRIIAAILLLAALAGAIWGAGVLREEYTAVRTHYDTQFSQLQALNEKAVQLQKTLENLTTETAQAQQAQAEQLLLDAQALREQLETLRTEIETMKTCLEENQDAIADGQAELTYLQGVYDELEKGLAQVEEYIAGN